MHAGVKRLIRRAVQHGTAGRVMWRGPAGRRRVALTFDDGPHALTARYLELLARHGVPATFFVLGAWVDREPAVLAEYLRAGHQVGGHGWDHQRFTRLRRPQLLDQLARTTRALGPLPHGRWVRPPHGALGPVEVATLLGGGYTVAMWSFDSRDHDGAAAPLIAERCAAARVRDGDVLLFHEGQESTLAALPAVISGLRDAGFELVTMADLVAA